MHHIRIWSSGTGNVLQAFHLQSFCILSFYKKTFRFTPAICKDCTVPRIRSGFLPTCEAQQGFTPTRKWRRHFCRQRTKFAAFTLSLQRGKRAAGFPFAKLLHTCLFTRGHSTSPQFTTASKSDRKNSCRFFVV